MDALLGFGEADGIYGIELGDGTVGAVVSHALEAHADFKPIGFLTFHTLGALGYIP